MFSKISLPLFIAVFCCYAAISFSQKGTLTISAIGGPVPTSDSSQYYQNLAAWFQLVPQYNLDSIQYYFDRAEMVIRQNDTDSAIHLAMLYKNEAQFHNDLQNFKIANLYAQKAMVYYVKSGNKQPLFEYQIRYLLAIATLFKGENTKALALFLDAAKLIATSPEPEAQAIYFNNRSYFYHIYGITEQQDDVLHNAEKSLAIYYKLNQPKDYLTISRLLTRVSDYYASRNPELAEDYLNKSEEYVIKSRDAYYPAFHILERTEWLTKKKQYNEAEVMVRKAIAQLQKYHLTLTNYYQYALKDMGEIKRNKKQLDSAIYFYKQSSVIADSVKYEKTLLENTRIISELYQEKGDYKNALLYYQQYANANFKIEKEKSERSLKEHDLESDILGKQKDLEKEHTKRNFLIGGMALLAGVIGFIFYILKRQRRLNTLLNKSNGDKEVLLKEIHHRVKNNLTVISSLLELQSDNATDERSRSTLLEGTNRVRSIALIHQRLYQHEDFAAIELRGFIDDLFKQIASVLKAQEQEVVLHNDTHITQLDIDTAVPLGLIMNELMTNSFKYAFALGKPGEMHVSLNIPRAGEYELVYKDNGPGLPVGFDFKKTDSLGLRLIRRLAMQLSGSARFEKADGFATFTITFKNLESRNQE